MKQFLAMLLMTATVGCAPEPALAGTWDEEGEDIASWFATQVVRDCCDQRDAYLADDFASDADGNYVAIITDGSANERYGKPAIPNGSRIVIPKDRVKSTPPAPGHGVVFLSKQVPDLPAEQRYVYCYFPPGGA